MSDLVMQGSGMDLVPELLLRQVLIEGMVELAGDEQRIDQLFERVDDMLQGTQDDWGLELKDALYRIADPAAPDGIRVATGYPDINAHMPWVSIVTEHGNEDEGEAVFGDLLDRKTKRVGSVKVDGVMQPQYQQVDTIGNEWTTTAQLGSWTESPEESLLLHAVVKHVIFRHKARLSAAGVRELSFSESGFLPSPQMQERTGWVPVLSTPLKWTWRQTRRSVAPTTATVNPPKHTNDTL